jgi:predicted transcriptional regulator
MAESTEHAFLSDSVLSIMDEVSTSHLYAYKETERKRFDFSCDLATNWKRLMSGQTLWKHVEGIDKDVRILLSDAESDILIYVARNTMKNKATLHEVVSDYKKTELRGKLPRLRVFWIPESFDADKDDDRSLIYQDLKESMSKDLLLSIVLGGITPKDVHEFATWSGTVGVTFAVLTEIDRAGFGNYTRLGKTLNIGAALAKDRIIRLSLTGFIGRSDPNTTGSIYEVTAKGKTIIDLCGRLYRERHKKGLVDDGLRYICSLLGLNVDRVDVWNVGLGESSSASGYDEWGPIYGDASAMLARQIDCAVNKWGIILPDPHYSIPEV